MTNKTKWAIGFAVLGGIAASQSTGNALDVLLGAAIWFGIAYGVGTVIQKIKSR